MLEGNNEGPKAQLPVPDWGTASHGPRNNDIGEQPRPHFQPGTGAPEEHQRLGRNSAIVDEVTGQMIGDCEAELRGDGFVHVLYAVFAPWRGQGVAERAVRLLADYSAEAFPYCPLLFRVERDNVASLAVARTVGAVVTGQEVVSDGRRLLHLMVAVDDRCRVGAAGEP